MPIHANSIYLHYYQLFNALGKFDFLCQENSQFFFLLENIINHPYIFSLHFSESHTVAKDYFVFIDDILLENFQLRQVIWVDVAQVKNQANFQKTR